MCSKIRVDSLEEKDFQVSINEVVNTTVRTRHFSSCNLNYTSTFVSVNYFPMLKLIFSGRHSPDYRAMLYGRLENRRKKEEKRRTNKVKRLTQDEQPLSGVEVRYQSLGNLSTDVDVEDSESVI